MKLDVLEKAHRNIPLMRASAKHSLDPLMLAGMLGREELRAVVDMLSSSEAAAGSNTAMSRGPRHHGAECALQQGSSSFPRRLLPKEPKKPSRSPLGSPWTLREGSFPNIAPKATAFHSTGEPSLKYPVLKNRPTMVNCCFDASNNESRPYHHYSLKQTSWLDTAGHISPPSHRIAPHASGQMAFESPCVSPTRSASKVASRSPSSPRPTGRLSTLPSLGSTAYYNGLALQQIRSQPFILGQQAFMPVKGSQLPPLVVCSLPAFGNPNGRIRPRCKTSLNIY